MTVDIVPPAGRPLRIVIPGSPVGKARPRFVRATGRTYTPQQTATYENLIKLQGEAAMNGDPPWTVPLRVDIVACMPVAASWSKRKQAAALAGGIRPGRPDVDNILKIAADGLNRVVWADDALISEVTVTKRYDQRPRLEIVIEAVPVRARA